MKISKIQFKNQKWIPHQERNDSEEGNHREVKKLSISTGGRDEHRTVSRRPDSAGVNKKMRTAGRNAVI